MEKNFQFFYEERQVPEDCLEGIQTVVNGIVNDYGFVLMGLNVIFLSDEGLLKMNREFLGHDFYTDVITFDLEENANPIQGEIYISVDRVKDNAGHFGKDFKDELQRVIIHGVLHLVGFTDNNESEKSHMSQKENQYLENKN